MAKEAESKDNESDAKTVTGGCFDIRVDSIKPGGLYLASGVDADGTAISSFVHVIEKHVNYNHPVIKERPDVSTPEGFQEMCRRMIFWLVSDDLQFDEDSYVDASWAAESIAVSHEFKLLSTPLKQPKKEFDTDVLQANDGGFAEAPFRVLDLACGIGGNLVYIGKNSDLAVGVEYNPKRVEICRNNVKVHELTNTFVVQDDLFAFLESFALDPKKKADELGFGEFFSKSLEFDCVHISPPWGGKMYAGSSDERIYELQHNFDIERAMAAIAQIGAMVSLYLPRSQSVCELVRMASTYGYPLVIISAYYINKKVRCVHAHFLKRIESFKYVKFSKCDKGTMNFHPTSCGIKMLIDSQTYKSKIKDLRSSLHMDHVLFCLMKMLDENSHNVALKLSNLMRLYPLVDILGIASKALEIQYAGGMTKAESHDKRTTGGIFFYLLKTQQKELYKQVEKLSQ